MKKLMLLSLIIIMAIPLCKAQNSYPIPEDKDVLITFGKTKESKISLNPENINLLVWNMYKGEKIDWASDLKMLSHEKDILMLQEGFLGEKMKTTFRQIDDFRYDFATSFYYKEKLNTPTGVLTGSKIAPKQVYFARSPGREPVLSTPKMTLFTEYSIKGSSQTLLTANIHALNVVPVIDQAKQLWEIEKILKNHQGPIIFAGDFNTWSWGKVETMKRVMRRLGMSEVSFNPDLRRLLLGEIIDYIFIKDLEVLESQVFPVETGSDHPAMTARFRFVN